MAETPPATFTSFVQDLAKSKEETRLVFAQQLKKAGLLKGEPTSVVNKTNYFDALGRLEELYVKRVSVNKILGIETDPNRINFLAAYLAEGNYGTGSDTGEPKTTAQTYITSPSQTAKLVNTVAQDLLGRDLTEAEQAKYLKLVNAQQKAEPAMQTTGSGFTTTRGGVDEQQFVTEQIAQTGEARTKRATDAYSMMLQELGGLQ
jgi:hypothetical protein